MGIGNKKKKLFIWLGIIILFFALIIFCLSLFTPKYIISYIEENDVEIVDREITIQDLSFNPLNFTFKIIGFQMTEKDKKSLFLSCESLVVNFEPLPLIKSKLDVESLTANNLYIHFIQQGSHFNFIDLFENDKESNTEKDSSSLEFNLNNINVVRSRIDYTDKQINSKISLDSIAIKDQSFKSSDTIFDADVQFHQKEGGFVNGMFSFNLKNNNYNVEANIKEWQLSPFKSYVDTAIHLNKFDGQIEADFNVTGNASTNFIKTKGQVSINNLELIDPDNKDLVSVGKFFVDVKEIDSKNQVYDFKDIIFEKTDVNFEYLPNGDNFTKWLVNTGETSLEENHESDYYVSPFELLSIYIYDMTKEYIFKSYTAENIVLSNFNLKFYDYTIEDPFFMDLSEVTIKAKDIRPENQFAKFNVHGRMNNTGIIDGAISVSRQGVENMTVDIGVKGLILNKFSPYGRYYTGHRFVEGVSSFNNKSVIKDSYLTSMNKMFIENIEVSKKEKTKSGNSLPMRLAVSLMKNSDGNINLDIPIEGPINDPKYKFGKVVWQVVKNIFTKVATSPFKALSNVLKVNEDDLKNIYFDNGQVKLSKKQKKTLDVLVNVLDKKTDVTIELNHLYNLEYEKDAIGLKLAKKAYLEQSNVKLDSNIPIGKQAFDLSSTDPEFLNYLKTNYIGYDDTISIAENSRKFIGVEQLEAETIATKVKQKKLLNDYLINDKGVSKDRFKITDGSSTEEALSQSRPKFEVKIGVE